MDLDDSSSNEEIYFTGTQINYYFVCTRKLWLFSHHIDFEHESDLVKLGDLLHQERYKKKLKEIQLERVKLDFIENGNEIHEIKKSRKLETAHMYQLLYYLYFMKKYYNLTMTGVLNYPLLRKKILVDLTKEKEAEIITIVETIKDIINNDKPPEPIWKNYCKSCAYREFCWA